MRVLKLWLPVLVWAGLILSSANDEFSAAETGGWLERLFGEVPSVLHVLLRKLTHVVVYAILGALAWRADRRWLVALAVALAVAVTDETMQGMTRTRTGSAWDVVLDTVAAGIAIFLLGRWRAGAGESRHLRAPGGTPGRGRPGRPHPMSRCKQARTVGVGAAGAGKHRDRRLL